MIRGVPTLEHNLQSLGEYVNIQQENAAVLIHNSILSRISIVSGGLFLAPNFMTTSDTPLSAVTGKTRDSGFLDQSILHSVITSLEVFHVFHDRRFRPGCSLLKISGFNTDAPLVAIEVYARNLFGHRSLLVALFRDLSALAFRILAHNPIFLNGVRLCPPEVLWAGMGRTSPVEPATGFKVETPLEEGCCG